MSIATQIVNAHGAALNAATSNAKGAVSVPTQPKAPPPAPSSGLSVDEWLLVDDVGYEPCGLLAGASVFHIGLVRSWMRTGNRELEVLSGALASARERAAANLAAQAIRVQADGVVGVRLTIEAFAGKSHLARVVALGTGVRRRSPLKKVVDQAPFLSALSGQEFAVLARGGHEPVALAMGVCVYHVRRQGVRAWVANVPRNVEMAGYTEALYEARELAMGRLQAEALAEGADGVVGVTTSELSHVWGSRVIEFFAIGTAIRATGDHQPLTPRFVLPVREASGLTDPVAVVGAFRSGAEPR